MQGCVYLRNTEGVYQYCNNEFSRLFGLHMAKDVINQNEDFLKSRITPFLKELFVLLEDDDEFIKINLKNLSVKKIQIRDQVGSLKYFYCHRVPVVNLESGDKSLLGVMIASNEKDAIDKANLLENIITFIPGSVYWMDRKGTYLGCNNEAAKMIGLHSRDELLGKTIYDIGKDLGWTEGVAEALAKDDKEVMALGEPKNIDQVPFYDANGDIVYQITNKAPIRDAVGNVIGLVGNSVDITKQKLIEQSLEKAKAEADAANQAKSDFLAMMTHELRTPLNIILGMTQLMKTENCTHEQTIEYLQTITNSGRSLLGLINDILDFSKAQAGKLQLREEPFELEPLLQQLQKEFTVKAEERNITYFVKRLNDLPHYLIVDGQRLRQIIYNLSDNALKFTGHGSVQVSVESFQVSDPGKIGLRFKIIDTGVGIPKDKINTIFEEFTQISTKTHNQYSRKYGGVGLGLAIVRQLIDLMQGKISVDSEYGVGTTFTCEFVFNLPNEEQMEELQSGSEASFNKEKLKASKVLLVEDNLLNQKVVTKMLERLNCQVDIAVDGSEALVKMKRPYDLVFMDMSLPDMSGIEVVKDHRAQEKPSRHQTIIALTANIHEDDKKACLEAGMDGFLTKPLMMDDLYKLLKEKTSSRK